MRNGSILITRHFVIGKSFFRIAVALKNVSFFFFYLQRLEDEKILKLASLFCIKVYKKSFKDFYSGFLNDKRAFIVLVEYISIFSFF